MSRLGFLRVALTGSLVCSLAMSAWAADPRLSARYEERLRQEVAPAYQRGDTFGVLVALSPIVGKLDAERLKLADAVLAKESVPPINKLLSESRRELIEQGRGGVLPKPTLQELAIVAPYMATEIRGILDDAAQMPVMAKDLPRLNQVAQYERPFWQIHVMQNRLFNARRLAQYTGNLTLPLRNARMDKLEPHQREAIVADYAAAVQQIDVIRQELFERSLEMRLERLRVAANVLVIPEVDEERFLAAFSIATDSRILKDYFHGHPAPTRTALKAPDLLEEVTWLEKTGRERGGDLIGKSELLFHGIHWWLRGRYGRGSDGFGLFKSEYALNSPEEMFQLVMPREPSEAARFLSDADDAYPVQRRHYYAWAWEDRVQPFRKIEAGFF